MAFETIIFDVLDDVAVIRFNRPKALNAIIPDVLREVNEALDSVETNTSIRVLILTGEGDKAFVLEMISRFEGGVSTVSASTKTGRKRPATDTPATSKPLSVGEFIFQDSTQKQGQYQCASLHLLEE